jgi:zinc protease
MEIGGMEASGFHWKNIDRILEKLKAVTAADVQAVAKKYFSDDVLTIAVLDPQPIDPNAPKKPALPLKH